VECVRSHILRSSAIELEYWLCALDTGALNHDLLGSSIVRSITPSALERTGRDKMCILANSTL
jgi:hypothetical protein